jgi:hypothetical protein
MPNQSHTRQELEAVLGSYRIHNDYSLYHVGPFGKRVSFQSQQRRAINLIFALAKIDRDITSKKIAVIGGGITGRTVTASLLRIGARVWLFETKSKNEDPIRNCHCRFIHPNINFIPAEDLSYTTELPVLNWYAHSAHEVYSQIDKGFNRIQEKNKERYRLERSEVARITGHGESGKILIDVNDREAGRIRAYDSYDVVIVCAGFSEETALPSNRRAETYPRDLLYWAGSGTHQTAGNKNNKKEVLVIGGGDGGVIDALEHGTGWDGPHIHHLALKAVIKCEDKQRSNEQPASIFQVDLEDYHCGGNDRLKTYIALKKSGESSPWHKHLLDKAELSRAIHVIYDAKATYEVEKEEISINCGRENESYSFPLNQTHVVVRIGASHKTRLISDFLKKLRPAEKDEEINAYIRSKEEEVSRFQLLSYWEEELFLGNSTEFGADEKIEKVDELLGESINAFSNWQIAYRKASEDLLFQMLLSTAADDDEKPYYKLTHVSGKRIIRPADKAGLPGLPHLFGISLKMASLQTPQSGVVDIEPRR